MWWKRPKSTSTSVTNIRPRAKLSSAKSQNCRPAVRCCICGAAPAPISAVRNPRCWKASMDNIPLDFGTLEKYGCFIGSAAVIILSEQDSVKGAALNLMRFFEDESCGQCTPCRVGTQKAALLMEKPVWNRELLDELSQAMRDASICGLGQAASNPLTSVIKYFPGEFLPKEASE